METNHAASDGCCCVLDDVSGPGVMVVRPFFFSFVLIWLNGQDSNTQQRFPSLLLLLLEDLVLFFSSSLIPCAVWMRVSFRDEDHPSCCCWRYLRPSPEHDRNC